MNIVLIGSNGFLSNSIGEFCNDQKIEIDVWGLEKPNNFQSNKYFQIDLLNQEIDYSEISSADIIIYSAGAGIQSNQNDSFESVYYLNSFIPIKLYKELIKRKYKGYLITFGSYFEFGENDKNLFLTETDIINATNMVPNDYCISKRLLTKFIISSHVELKYWHFILPTIYGENENPNRLIPYIVNSIKRETEIKLTSGEQIRQYLYVDDIPPIIIKAFKNHLNSGIYNLAGTENISVKDLVENIFKYYKSPQNKSQFGSAVRNDTKMKILKLDNSKLSLALNAKPSTKIINVLPKYK